MLFLAFLMNYRKSFSLAILLILIQPVLVEAQSPGQEEKEPVKSELSLKLRVPTCSKSTRSCWSKRSLLKAYLKDGFPKLAETLYEEILPKKLNEEDLKDFSNYALSKIQNGKKGEGLEDSKRMLEYLEKNKVEKSEELKKALEKNILKAIRERRRW